MALSFGVTVLPDPPYQRLIDLLVLGERHGFEYGWTYDSHVLWQESTPTIALAAAATERAGMGASWPVKWSGIVAVAYPRSSMRRIASTQPLALAGPDSWTPNRKGRCRGSTIAAARYIAIRTRRGGDRPVRMPPDSVTPLCAR